MFLLLLFSIDQSVSLSICLNLKKKRKNLNQQKVVRLLAVQFECFSTESISGYNREITATDCAAAAAAISHWVVYKWNWLHLRPVISEEKNKFCSPNKNRNKNGKKRKKKWRGFDVVT